jgi:hypothetical protein
VGLGLLVSGKKGSVGDIVLRFGAGVRCRFGEGVLRDGLRVGLGLLVSGKNGSVGTEVGPAAGGRVGVIG